MNRVPRFESFRFVGARDTMVVYDCDAPDELQALVQRVEDDDLVGRLLISAFAPDTLAEARNRGFTTPDIG